MLLLKTLKTNRKQTWMLCIQVIFSINGTAIEKCRLTYPTANLVTMIIQKLQT